VLKTPFMEQYEKEVRPALINKFRYRNVMQVPRLTKITVNMGLGEAIQNVKALDAASGDMALIAGQKPVITKASKSIASFKLRKGMPIGCMVTLRRERMFEFYQKLVTIVLPRVRDFKGISPKSFDGRGNYTLGLKEQIIFPEIEYDKVDRVRGMNITITTTAETDEEAFELLKLMGMPFRS
jgi:large subunit ribosomal protein L5